jgi:hypothetical protein
MDTTLFDDVDFKVGQGSRGLRKKDGELEDWNSNWVYIECLNCSYKWNITKTQWEADNIPEECLSCSAKLLSFEYIRLNAVPQLEVDGQLIDLNEKDQALIYRLVRKSSI